MKLNWIELLLAVVFSGLVAFGVSLVSSSSDKTLYVATSFLLILIPASGVLGLSLSSSRMTVNLKISSLLILALTIIIDAGFAYFNISESWFLLTNGFLLFVNLLAFYIFSKFKNDV